MAQIQNNTDKTKNSGTLKLFLFILIFLVTIATYVFSSHIFGEDSIFNSAPTGNVTLNTLWQAIPKILKTVQIITLTIIIQKILRFIASKSLAKTKRGITISKLFDSFIKYLIAIIAILLVLGAWGVDTETLIASAGILGLVIGLGAQSLIADIIAGVFIVFEGAYEVGDIVVIDGWRGTVSEIGIRTTKLIDAGGNIKVINNSNVVTVINQTKELSLATCTIRIEYGENLERVEAIINENLANINKKIPTMMAVEMVILGIVGIIMGGNIVVENASVIAANFGMSQTLIGLTIVAIGTSLPELVTSMVAAKKGESDIALGNAIGSNVFNIVFILGFSAIISPMTVDVLAIYDTLVLLAVSVLTLVFAKTNKRFSRSEGAVMLAIYAIYFVYAILR